MGNFTKWIAGGLGWAFFGPVGGLIGFLVGSFIEPGISVQKSPAGGTTAGDFALSLLVLVAALMKADGKVLKSELDYVKQFFVRQFGKDSAKEALIMLKDLLKKEIPLNDVCEQISRNMDYSSRLQLLHILFNISAADERFDTYEVEVIGKISDLLGIASGDYLSIKNMFIPETDSAYKILEISPSASNDEVKKAYRRMALKYHPDKVSHLGEDFRKTADEKFKKVNEAYARIKKQRNII